jgi:hypothetical protein
MRFKFVLILGAIAVLAIVAVGCGGGSDSTSSSTTAKKSTSTDGSSTPTKSEDPSESKQLTKSEFATRVNESCIQVPPTYEEELEELEKGGKKPSKQEIATKAVIPPLDSAVEELETLNPPANEQQDLEKVIAAMESAIKGVEEEPAAELSGPKSPFAEFQKVTKELGFETCSGL